MQPALFDRYSWIVLFLMSVMGGMAAFGQSTGVAATGAEEAARQLAEQKAQAYQEQRHLAEEARAANAALMEQVRSKSICLAGTDTAFSSLKGLYSQFKTTRRRPWAKTIREARGRDGDRHGLVLRRSMAPPY